MTDSGSKPEKPPRKFVYERRVKRETTKQELRLNNTTLTVERLMYEWAVTGGEMSIRQWCVERKGYTEIQYKEFLAVKPSGEWFVLRKRVQDDLTHSLVKSHVDFVAEMNDTHIKASKLGLAKAIDMMTRMRIEEKRDKKGNVYFAGFRPADLARCMESIKTAQYIQRRALGLPNDEGSITTWQRIQHERKDEVIVSAADGSVVTESSTTTTTTEQVKSLETSLSYDDIKLLIDAERRRKKEEAAGGRVIEAEAKPV